MWIYSFLFVCFLWFMVYTILVNRLLRVPQDTSNGYHKNVKSNSGTEEVTVL